jgi:hypothetical protein
MPNPAPVVIDGTTISEHTDFVELARKAFSGDVGGWFKDDLTALQPTLRVWERLSGSAYQSRLALGIAEHLTNADPTIRWAAVAFFEHCPEAPGGERLCDLVLGPHRALFPSDEGSTTPTGLEETLLRALARRLSTGDARARELARLEALRPHKAVPLIASLTQLDTEWTVAHVEEIVSRSPDALAPLIWQLVKAGRDVGPIADRLSRVEGIDPQAVRSALSRARERLARIG